MFKKLLIIFIFYNIAFADWQPLTLPNSSIHNIVCNDDIVYAISVHGEVYASYDQGDAWDSIVIEHNEILPYGFDVFEIANNYLFISQNIAPPYYNYRANIDIGEWELIPYQDSAFSKLIVYEDYLYAISSINEGILVSNDFGISWEIIISPIPGYVKLLLVDTDYIYVSYGCNLYRISKITFVWENITGILDDTGPPEPYSCTMVNSLESFGEELVISMYWYGGAGMLFNSLDNGNNWIEISSFPPSYPSGYTDSISDILYKNGVLYAGTATSQNGIFYTEDLFEWEEYSNGLSSFSLSVNQLFATNMNLYKIGGTVNIFKNHLINAYHLGDVNQDGIINVLDIVTIINMIMDGEYSMFADINEDDSVDILDVVLMVTVIVGGLP
tara:strand:+ start:166 stop:1323 length:1158 start_codon:yes stop_codon:yes gene_type:complete